MTEADSYVELRSTLAKDWIDFFSLIDAIPILIPNALNNIEEFLTELNLDAVILSGGNNVSPSLYGAAETLSDVYVERDKTETEIIEVCLKNDLPLVGICRGMCMVNVFFDGTIYHGIENHVATRHTVSFSMYDHLLGECLSVNSYHNQAIFKDDLSPELVAFGFSESQNVEAFKHREKQIFGIQWHPERDLDELVTINFIKKVLNRGI